MSPGIGWTAALAVLAAGCWSVEPPGDDVVPPTVTLVLPRGEAVEPAGVRVEVWFSEEVESAVVEQQLLVLVPDALLDEAYREDLDRPPLTAKRAADRVAGTILLLDHGWRATFSPAGPLLPDTAYAVAVSAAVCDLAGNPLVASLVMDERGRVVAPAGGIVQRFRTRPAPAVDPVARTAGAVFTEILANPSGTESEGEYLEILLLGEEPVDLSGWQLAEGDPPAPGDALGPCAEGDSTLAQPGVPLLVTGTAFRPPSDLAPGVPRVCAARTTLTPRGLLNGGGEVLWLLDPQGQPIDRYGGWLDLSGHEDCAGERLDPAGPDGPDNWTIADGEPCRSPGWLR